MNELQMVINTLNDIEVKGRSNMDKLLGCIMMLEQIIKVSLSDSKPEEGEETDGR